MSVYEGSRIEHEQLATDLVLRVYFRNPQSPWQRGCNENTNRLLRQCSNDQGCTERDVGSTGHDR